MWHGVCEMNKTPYKDIVEIADTYGVEAAILLTSCESERDVQWARTAVLLDEYINISEYVVPDYNKKPLYYSRTSFEIEIIPNPIVIKGRV